MALEKTDVVEDVSDVSDCVDCLPEIPPPDDSEDTDTPTEAGTKELSGVQNRIEVRSPFAMDDRPSTCSSDSVASVVLSVPHKVNTCYQKTHKSPSSFAAGRSIKAS